MPGRKKNHWFTKGVMKGFEGGPYFFTLCPRFDSARERSIFFAANSQTAEGSCPAVEGIGWPMERALIIALENVLLPALVLNCRDNKAGRVAFLGTLCHVISGFREILDLH